MKSRNRLVRYSAYKRLETSNQFRISTKQNQKIEEKIQH